MRKTLITALVLFLSVAPAAADGPPDTLPNLPSQTGEEVCRGELKDTSSSLATCDAGLASCSEDRAVWQAIANECLGLPSGTSLETAKKKRVKKTTTPKKKRTKRRKVTRKRTPKPVPKAVKGEKGTDGIDGENGLTTVWTLRTMEPNKTCVAGGYLTMFGLDSNRNGVLDSGESDDFIAVCHGKNGKDGKDGKNGKDGRDGDDGVRPTVGTGTFVNALYAKGRPHSYAAFAVAGLGWPLNDTVSLTLEGGAAPGLDAAMMLRASLDWRLGSASGLKIGGLYEVVGLTDNNYANDQYSALTVGVYKDFCLHEGKSVSLSLRTEVSGIVGVDGFINSERKPRVAGGIGGGLGLHLNF